jgi:hypothetical protein
MHCLGPEAMADDIEIVKGITVASLQQNLSSFFEIALDMFVLPPKRHIAF